MQLIYLTVLTLFIDNGLATAPHFIPGIGQFELLDYPSIRPPSVSRSKRSLDSPPTELNFQAFGRSFTVIVYPDESIISPTASVVVGGKSFPLSQSHSFGYPVRGFLKSHPNSLVFGTILDGVFRGTIAPNAHRLGLHLMENATEEEDVFFVEPAGNFLQHPTVHSVIYRASGVKNDAALRRKRRNAGNDEPAFCGHSNPDIARKLRDMSEPVPSKFKHFVFFCRACPLL